MSCQDGHCAVSPCTDESCDTYFVCDASTANTLFDGCQRRGCTASSDCGADGGSCVNFACYAEPGQCGEPLLFP